MRIPGVAPQTHGLETVELCRNKGESHRTKAATMSAEMCRAYVNAIVV
jgi:hypothetical protein